MARGEAPTAIHGGSAILRVEDLSSELPNSFFLSLPRDARVRLARETGALAISKFSFAGKVTCLHGGDWHLSARLGATIVQHCVVSLAEMKTRIDVEVERKFVKDPAKYEAGPDHRMPDDDSLELLIPEIDLYAIAHETLFLEMSPYPRISNACLDDSETQVPEHASATREERPFASLSSLL